MSIAGWITWVGMMVVTATMVQAQERVAAPIAPATAPEARRGRAVPQPEDIARQLSERLEMLQKEAARFETESTRAKDDPEMAASRVTAKNVMAALIENLTAQVAAAKAGEMEKVQNLSAQYRNLEVDAAKIRNVITLSRRAAEYRAMAGRIPAAAGDSETARQTYVKALTALADFYAQQARNPPASSPGRSLPPDLQATENALRAANDRAQVDFEYQISAAQLKALAEKCADVPAVKSACETLIEKSSALRDAKVKLVEAQDVVQTCLLAKRQAEEALEKAKNENMAALRQKGAPEGQAPGRR